MTPVLRLVGVNNGAGHDHKGVLRRVLWVFSGPFTVFKCRPCSAIFNLHYTRFGVTGTLREECHGVTTTKRINGTTEEGLAVFVLAVYRNVSRAVKDLAQHGIHEETGCIARSACHHGQENSDLCSNNVKFCGGETPRLCDIN
jgi:hypothetical protein